ncbi:cytochrome P450 [Streptomyces sp. NPDC005962]|uniref:cytochrome P450 n=1 Tax=Streptomyces sp. NPDC005962 TaxID=3154466 RepID=UPI0033F95018
MTPPDRAYRRARRRDRRVYQAAHPVLLALLAATRARPAVRLGSTVLVHDADACRQVLTRVPLDRDAEGSTGGAARAALSGPQAWGALSGPQASGLLFDQEGGGHRATRRGLADGLGAAGVERLRPVWRAVLTRRLGPLAEPGGTVDLVAVAREVAGATVCALLDVDADPRAVASAASDAAAAAVRDHLPGPRRPGGAGGATAAARRLQALLAADGRDDGALRAMLATAAVTTTVAALPRAAAWCADAGLWEEAADDRLRPALVAELLRVVAPSPVLPRVAAADATVAGVTIRRGDRIVLVARHAVRAHRTGPDARCPVKPAVSQLVFGAGPHACPGARLARAQLRDTLAALSPYRPAVVRARAERHAALPGWRALTVRARERP